VPPTSSSVSRWTTSKYSANVDSSWPPSSSLTSLIHSRQVHLWVHFLLASQCISKVTQWLPPSSYPSSLDYCPQVYLQFCLITFLRSISDCTWSQPPSVFWTTLDHGLQVHLYIHTITGYKSISEFPQWVSLGASVIIREYGLPQDGLHVYPCWDLDWTYMPHYDVANHVTITKMKIQDVIACSYGTLRTNAVRIWLQDSHRATQRSQLLLKSPADLHRGLRCSKMCLSYMSNIIASCIHLHNLRWFGLHRSMLLHWLRALCLSPAETLGFWNFSEALVTLTSISGRYGCIIWIYLHMANLVHEGVYCYSLKLTLGYIGIQSCQYNLNSTGISGMSDWYLI